MKITELRPQRKNANKHTPYGLRLLEKSVQNDGWLDAQTAAADGEIISGSARLELAAEKFADVEPIIVDSDGTRPVIIRRTDIPNAETARARRLSVAANKIAQVDFDPDFSILQEWAGEDEQIRKLFSDDEWREGTGGIGGGEEPPAEPRKTLAERFGVPPFSVLDARQGYWQDRKRAWIALGLKGELGRGDALLLVGDREDLDDTSRKNLAAGRKSFGKSNSSQNSLVEIMKSKSKMGTSHEQMLAFARKHNIKDKIVKPDACDTSGGTSIFDPVLSELLYRWFTPKGGHILNPMSGEATHGIVAGHLGYKFTGVELRPEQAESNREQARNIGVDPVWITADALTIDALGIAPADFVVSCPPYADLEVYSDNPLDISTMEYADFISTYSEIIKKSCAILRDDRFAAFVVGEVRDKNGIYYDFVGDTIKAFKAAGLKYYNEMILVTSVGSLPIRAGRQFDASRKIGKTHQNVLVFLKGDSKRAVKACGQIEMELPDEFDTND